jgi:hypothetical protein
MDVWVRLPSSLQNKNEMKAKPQKDDCGCGKPLKVNDPKKKIIRKIPKKK